MPKRDDDQSKKNRWVCKEIVFVVLLSVGFYFWVLWGLRAG